MVSSLDNVVVGECEYLKEQLKMFGGKGWGNHNQRLEKYLIYPG